MPHASPRTAARAVASSSRLQRVARACVVLGVLMLAACTGFPWPRDESYEVDLKRIEELAARGDAEAQTALGLVQVFREWNWEEAMAALTPELSGATIDVLGSVNRPPMPASASEDLFALARRVAPWVEGAAVGGGSDGNFTGAAGVPTLDGLGAVGGGAHADHEWVEVDTMPERARLVAGIIEHLPT